ncbi:uncharacterized protein B0T15DRAFT_278596 [Chaetomium strumarium]|uniref:Uncharacterized protein n=1 Tax=Chaetomium strumarium TaxID=1170767 RepID=A0AAJ0LZK9_9PEZI|nr:hypothetical protein B0T15DRAFT_278596 [Chaetomium strumarium]
MLQKPNPTTTARRSRRFRRHKTATRRSLKVPDPQATIHSDQKPTRQRTESRSLYNTKYKRQLVIINMERKQRKEMVERHRSTGDPREFAAFLLPFIPPVELGEWQWDDGVQRWWREDKTTGARLWVPVEDAFL